MTESTDTPPPGPPRRSVEVLPDAASLAPRAAGWLIEQIDHAIAKRGRAVIALSGGSTPKALYELLARPPWVERVQWPLVHVFWGDERFVAADDPDRNDRMAATAWLDRVDLPAAHVYAMPADDGADDDLDAAYARASDAAALYETSLHGFYGGSRLDAARPFFDVVLLGLGEDGHTASLFPGETPVDERVHWVLPVRTDGKPPPVRITMTLPILESTHAVLFLVSGEGKRNIARRVLGGDDTLPSARVRPVGGSLWIMDEAAAGRG